MTNNKVNVPDRFSVSETTKNRAAEILPVVYDELRQLANAKMAYERPGQTISATSLVHEAFLRVTKNGDKPTWESERHFFAAAAIAMRRILIETAIRKKRQKRGGGKRKLNLHELPENIDVNEFGWENEYICLEEALQKLEFERAEAAQLVDLRYFAGMKMKDAARAMNISERTAHRYWQFAKAWLCEYLDR